MRTLAHRTGAITNLTELWDALESHDWFYEMSDDHGVWCAGNADWSRIKACAAQIAGGVALCDAFNKHHYSGPPWNTPKEPKPPRPCPVANCPCCDWDPDP